MQTMKTCGILQRLGLDSDSAHDRIDRVVLHPVGPLLLAMVLFFDFSGGVQLVCRTDGRHQIHNRSWVARRCLAT
jgi:hypothetical protein